MDDNLPPIVKGASLLIAFRLEGRRVLLIGGGAVAASRLYFLLEAGAHITLISPTVCPEIQQRLRTNGDDIQWLSRPYAGRQDAVRVEDFAMVLTAIDDNALSLEVCELCRAQRVTVNVADVPPQCDFYFGAQARRGPMQLMVSTQGQGPKIGVMLRDMLVKALPPNLEEAISGVGSLRKELRARAPGVGGELSKRRMEWMKATCDAWTLDEMADLRDAQVRQRVLDEGWDTGKVLGPRDVGLRRTRLQLGPEVWSGVGGFVTGAAIAGLLGIYLARR